MSTKYDTWKFWLEHGSSWEAPTTHHLEGLNYTSTQGFCYCQLGGSHHTSFGGSELYWDAWILLLDNLRMFGQKSVVTLKSTQLARRYKTEVFRRYRTRTVSFCTIRIVSCQACHFSILGVLMTLFILGVLMMLSIFQSSVDYLWYTEDHLLQTQYYDT